GGWGREGGRYVGMLGRGERDYLTHDIKYVRIDSNVEAKISRLDEEFSQISFVDNNARPVPVPANVNVVFQSNLSQAGRFGDVFVISWRESYVFLRNGVELFRLDNRRQQAIGGGPDLVTRVVRV
ncbi:hypothetical protein Vafri_8671, partial [Volvox africanus]